MMVKVSSTNLLQRQGGVMMDKGAECNVHLLVPYPTDNSGSPSVVEQSQQGHSSSCNSLLIVISDSVGYPMPYACRLALCNVRYVLQYSARCSFSLEFPVLSDVSLISPNVMQVSLSC